MDARASLLASIYLSIDKLSWDLKRLGLAEASNNYHMLLCWGDQKGRCFDLGVMLDRYMRTSE